MRPLATDKFPSPPLGEKVASVSEPDEGEARKRHPSSQAARPSPSHRYPAGPSESLPRAWRAARFADGASRFNARSRNAGEGIAR
jgi:hypothetical protein